MLRPKERDVKEEHASPKQVEWQEPGASMRLAEGGAARKIPPPADEERQEP